MKSDRAWWLTSYEDVVLALTDPRFGKQTGPVVRNPLLQGLFFRDPPSHTRLRSLISRAFTPSVSEGLRPRIRDVVRDTLEVLRRKGTVDLMREFAFPIPATIIAAMLGVPLEDHALFRALSDRVVRGMDLSRPYSVRKDGTEAHAELMDYFSILIAQRQGEERKDVIGGLILAEEEGDRLSREEMLSTCVALLVGGHETTANLIGNGLFALLSHPGQLEKLRHHPDLVGRAVEELLRFDGPFQRVQRIAKEDIVVGGKEFRKGDRVMCVLGSANHDPEVFMEPEELDIERVDNPHVAFGRGIHFCLGAPLARVEAQEAFRLLLESPDLRLAGEPAWKDNTAIRGLERLPVVV